MDVAIEAIRVFNRFFTRHVGAIDARFLDTDITLTEARLLFEIARQEPISANMLQAELGLDRGYLSRMIGQFESRGWIMRGHVKADARTRPISLTQSGREVFDHIDQRQRAAVAHDLNRLSTAEQDELVQALTRARLLLDPGALTIPKSCAKSTNVLDRPVWSALTGRQAHLAQGDEVALRFAPEYGPFAAACDPTGNLHSLGHLAHDTELWLLERHPVDTPAGLKVARRAECVQMVARSITYGGREYSFCDLGDEDAAEMLALASLAKPGPFSTKTHQLGRFIGIRENEVLVAMAGERLKPGIFTELSGVCTHPDYRGRGYAGFLMWIVASRMMALGEVPFLHCYATNAGAIALYQGLGFEIHQTVTATVLIPA